MLQGRRILLIIGGGIAAYKSLDLIRKFQVAGASVVPVLTKAAEEFVTPLSAGALAGAKAYRDLFDLKDEAEMGHIELSREADLVVLAPATADLMAKMANGLATDLASTLLMATNKPVLIAPAMNVKMWEHPATQRNLKLLIDDGIHIAGPDEGNMACGEFGMGRMAEPEYIVKAATDVLLNGPLKGKHVIVTSGPTHEPIDPVRYLANRSSGAQGTALANAFSALGARVSFVMGPQRAQRPEGCEIIPVETAEQMKEAVLSALPADVAVFAAAVADFRVANASNEKIKKKSGKDVPELDFVQNPDILAHVADLGKQRPELVIGFAAETQDVAENAKTKRSRKKCDWIVANDVSPNTGIMGGDENDVCVIDDQGSEDWPRMSKRAVADKLALRISKALS